MNEEPPRASDRLRAALSTSPVVVLEQDRELRTKDEHLRSALSFAEAGTWTWDVATDTLQWSAESFAIYGRDPGLGPLRYAEWESYVHPDDLAATTTAIRAALDGHAPEIRVELRIHHPRRGMRSILAIGRVERAPDGTPVRFLGLNLDITERRHAEEAAAASERRLGYLVGLTDALRALTDPAEIQARATRLLGEHLEASRVHFTEVVDQGRSRVRHPGYCRGAPTAAAPCDLGDFPAVVNELRRAGTLVVRDAQEDPRLTPAEHAATAARSIGALVMVPLARPDGRMVTLAVHQAEPRAWTDVEVSIIEETAARTWADVERARAEAALRESSQALRETLRDAAAGTWEWDLATGALTWAPELYDLFGLPAAEGIDYARWSRSIHPDDLAAVDAAGRDAVEGRTAEYRGEFRILHPELGVRWLLSFGRADRAEDGTARRLRGLNIDITERKRTEEALRATEARFRRVFESTSTGIAIRDAEGKIQEVNPAFCRLVGYTAEELRGTRVTSLVHPDDRAPSRRSFLSFEAGEATFYEYEGRYVRKDGQPVWVHAAVCRLPGDLATASVVGLLTDVTQRRHAEEALRASESQFRAFFDNATVGMTELDLQGRFLHVNERLCQITGYPAEELRGMRAADLTPAGERAPVEALLGAYLRCEVPRFRQEKRYVRKDGRIIWVLVSATLVRDASGAPLRSAGIIEDITDSKLAAEALQASNERLREADRRKTDFLGVLSHELRNPLAPIRNSIYLLERAAPGSAPARKATEVLRRQVDHLTRLVDDLLDVTRITHGKVTLQPSLVDLREIVRKTADDQRSLFQHGGVELDVELPAGPVWVEADATRITQVLSNLLQNAAKFTPSRGHVVVGTTASEGRATAYVRDDGVGIEPAQMARMFEPFAQAEQSLARTQGGLGLGLALARGLVELHGGSIVARSDGLGRGAELVVTLPLAASTAEAPEAKPHRSADFPQAHTELSRGA